MYLPKTKHVLVVGSWAKEQITIENIKQTQKVKVFSYLDTNNPGIIALADDYKIGPLNDIQGIVEYAKAQAVDLVLVTTAEPLSLGVVDALRANHIACFGPTKKAARLESDKAFARHLLKKYYPEVVPEYGVFHNTEQAVNFARQMTWNTAVKPLGLTDGLGVKVAGEQLHNENEIEDYINLVLAENTTGQNAVIIEKKLKGEEFTLQCLVNGGAFIPTPLVQDFKKLYNQDKGPNTASMGSYSDANFLLPFVTQDIYVQAIDVIQKTLLGLEEDTGEQAMGFLYGQFMLCPEGLKLIEYNFRPGDPEWLNTVYLLKDNLLEVIDALMHEKTNPFPAFEKQATACKYIVPADYPQKMHQTLEATVDRAAVKNRGVDFYYSCGKAKEGSYPVGTERGIAFISGAESIQAASIKVDAAIAGVEGDFHYRSDIGSQEMLRAKKIMSVLYKDKYLRIRKASESDALKVYAFVSGCKPLENYAQHFYKIMLRYFGSTCYIAEKEGRIMGFVLGVFSQNSEVKTFFLWQIGISPKRQGEGVGKKMLRVIEDDLRKYSPIRIEATIDPENLRSQRLFEGLEYKNISDREGEVVTVAGNLAAKDYYSPGRHFMVYEKNL